MGRRCINQRKRSVVVCGLNNSQTTGTSTSATLVVPASDDVVRKLTYGDVDIGFVGHDMVAEIGDGHEELLIVHDALGYGSCHLALGVPAQESLRIWSSGGCPGNGCADIILDLVSTGVTLRENNLKEIEGGKIMESEGVLVVNKTSLLERPGMMELVHELLERLEAHLVAQKYYSVIVNMTGTSAEDVSERLIQAGLGGLQGPTVSSVYPEGAPGGYFAAIICVPKKELYPAVKSLRKLGGSGVLVQPMTYIFDDEPPRWLALTKNLGISTKSIDFA
eukprot:jgi/Picre1/34641/NNA_002109.t1